MRIDDVIALVMKMGQCDECSPEIVSDVTNQLITTIVLL